MSKVEEKVIDKIRQRAELGRKKYGTTMEREDLAPGEWLQHWQEECLDAAIYAQKLIDLFNPEKKESNEVIPSHTHDRG
jgi:hypothetical protein